MREKVPHSQNKKEDSFIQLHKDIAVSLNENKGLDEAMRYSVQRVCEETGWPVGHIYFPAMVGDGGLVPSQIWFCEDEGKFENFRKITEATPLAWGEGLPGRVLANGKPSWIMDVTKDPNFPRARLDEGIEVRAGFAFPVLIGKEVVGVMEFYSPEAVEPDVHLLGVMANIGTLLGRVVERNRAEKEIENSRRQLRELYQRIELVREEERSRIAREVHDELGQVLTALRLEFSLLNKKLSKENTDFKNNFDLMFGLIDDSIQSVKRISFDLRPPILDVLGLSDALAWQGKEFQERTGIEFYLDEEPIAFNLDPNRSTTLFRIFQEALTNVTNHSKASAVNVFLSYRYGHIVLVIMDNGQGITKEQCSDLKSLGMLGMRERAMIWEGTVNVFGKPGKGTSIIIKIPHEDLTI
ncbi:MAG: histidine kinase [Nitrospinales bacterium]